MVPPGVHPARTRSGTRRGTQATCGAPAPLPVHVPGQALRAVQQLGRIVPQGRIRVNTEIVHGALSEPRISHNRSLRVRPIRAHQEMPNLGGAPAGARAVLRRGAPAGARAVLRRGAPAGARAVLRRGAMHHAPRHQADGHVAAWRHRPQLPGYECGGSRLRVERGVRRLAGGCRSAPCRATWRQAPRRRAPTAPCRATWRQAPRRRAPTALGRATWRQAPRRRVPVSAVPGNVASGATPTGADSAGGCRVAQPAGVTQVGSSRASVASGSEPCPISSSWKRLMSNAAPSRASSSRRSLRISRIPVM